MNTQLFLKGYFILTNELILILSLVFTYGSVLFFYKYLGKTGLFVWSGLATILANIEVVILVDAFWMEQTLGNVLFASTFLVTDILSENHSKKSADKAVVIGILSNIVFVVISRSWFLYAPSENDWATPAMREVFSNTPRLILAGAVVYAISQLFDVWLYDAIWRKTTKIFKSSEKGLWIRNNGSTLISQLINTFLFTFGAFWGVEGYDISLLISISLSTYVVYVVASLCDTPAVYIARKIHKKQSVI